MAAEETKSKNKNTPPPAPPKETKVEDIKITLDEFCGSLPQTGVDQFAKVRLECRISEWGEHGNPRTRADWEALYLRVQES